MLCDEIKFGVLRVPLIILSLRLMIGRQRKSKSNLCLVLSDAQDQVKAKLLDNWTRNGLKKKCEHPDKAF